MLDLELQTVWELPARQQLCVGGPLGLLQRPSEPPHRLRSI
jgi:hypothetical protein